MTGEVGFHAAWRDAQEPIGLEASVNFTMADFIRMATLALLND